MPVIDRTNTNFSLQIFEYIRQLKWGSEYSFLRYFQNVVRIYLGQVVSGSRGLLVMHEMGLGKTIQALAVAIDMIREYSPIILSAKSLRENMISGIHKYVKLRAAVEPNYYLAVMSEAELDAWIAKNFSFVSSNAGNMANQMGRASQGIAIPALETQLGEISKLSTLNKRLIIVDEAHNLFRAITNGGKNGLAFYDMIMRSQDVKLIFLTGTPINTDPFELVPCFNMLAGANSGHPGKHKADPKKKKAPGRSIGSSDKYVPLLPETYREFTKLYVDPAGGIQNKGRFQNRIQGMISYISRETKPGSGFGEQVSQTTGTSIAGEFPEEYPMKVVRVYMSSRQYTIYTLARDKEHEEASGPKSRAPIRENPAMTKPKAETASTYRVRSRQYSNYASPMMLDAKTRVSLTVTGDDGEINTEDVSGGIQIESPKYDAILKNIEASPGVGLVYSQFVGAGGLGSFGTYLEQSGWEPFTRVNNNSSSTTLDPAISTDSILGEAIDDDKVGSSGSRKVYAVISGSVPIETRAYIQDVFNSESNRDGSIISLLLVSATGAEGLDLHRIRHIHIMEPYWNYARIAQIIARGVRNDSHIDLPADQKNVQPYIYLSIPPATETATSNPIYRGKETFTNPEDSNEYILTTDVELYTEALRSQVTINSFIDALKEVSIECMANGGKNCRVCAPTNEPIFTDNVELDSISHDPCLSATRSKRAVKTIEVDGVVYHYASDPSALYEYKVYVPAEDIGGFKEMPENDDRFEKILNKILEENSSKK